MRQLVLMFLLATALPASAQPFSQSMAECAGLHDALSRLTRDSVTRLRTDALAIGWADAAVRRADAEGQRAPDDYVAAFRTAKSEEWQRKGVLIIFSQDFRDWVDYCRSFADHMNIDIYGS